MKGGQLYLITYEFEEPDEVGKLVREQLEAAGALTMTGALEQAEAVQIMDSTWMFHAQDSGQAVQLRETLMAFLRGMGDRLLIVEVSDLAAYNLANWPPS